MATVWIVEDDDIVAQLVAELLTIHGYTVERHAGGQTAMEALRGDRMPDLIILDLMMVPPDGNDVLEMIGGMSMRPPVVLLTARPDYARRDLSHIPSGVIGKPFGMADMLRVVGEAVKGGMRFN